MIIWLASYPRSGNTFLRILLNHLYNIKTYSIYDDPLLEKLTGSSEVVGHIKLDMKLEEMAESEQIFFVKTHHLPADQHPAIYLVRDGRDSLISYAHYVQSFDKGHSLKDSFIKRTKQLFGWNEFNDILESLIQSSGGAFGSWSENVEAWTTRKEKTIVIRYEDLIQDPVQVLGQVMNHLTIEDRTLEEPKTFPSFEELHSKWSHFFRKGKSGSWKQEMNERQQEMFWQFHGEAMKNLNYS